MKCDLYSFGIPTNNTNCAKFRDVIVLFQTHGDLRIFVTGKEETDELLCESSHGTPSPSLTCGKITNSLTFITVYTAWCSLFRSMTLAVAGLS